MKHKAIAILGIWVGYGIAMVGISFGVGDAFASVMSVIIGAACATFGTAFVGASLSSL